MRKNILILIILCTATFLNLKAQGTCTIEKGFKEPKYKKGGTFKRLGSTLDDLKEHISVDQDVDIEKIILLRVSEKLGNGIYVLCIDGKKMKYRRTGSVFYKDGDNPLKIE